LPLRLTGCEWRALLGWFLRGVSSQATATETGLARTRVLRALLAVRQAMAQDVPPVFHGTVEVDETSGGGQRKNPRTAQRAQATTRGRGTTTTPVFGILCRGGAVGAQIVPDVQAQTLWPLIGRRVRPGSTICSDTWARYTGIAAKGYVHRLVDHSKGEYTAGRGTPMNGLEGFWGYLKRQLAAKGGIRRDRLPLYLAEYVWRYNHRGDSRATQLRRLLQLLRATPS
jgi:transposase